MKSAIKYGLIGSALTFMGIVGLALAFAPAVDDAAVDTVGNDAVAIAQDEPAAAEVEEPVVEEPLSEAELYKQQVVFYTNGILAKEAVALVPAEMMLEGKPAVCEALEVMTVEQAAAVLVDSFRKTGHDKEKSENMAEGFIRATTQPGVCG